MHKKSFNQVKEYYEQLLQLEVDPSGKDITRLCFVSWDEQLYLNPSAAVFRTYLNQVEDDIDKLTATIELRQLDLTKDYDTWLRIAFALADAIGEEGRSYFHRISQFYPTYDHDQCDAQFDKCLQSGNSGVTIATLFYLARDHGIDISRMSSVPRELPAKLEPLSSSSDETPEPRRKRRKNQIDLIEKYLNEHYRFRFNTVTNKLELNKLEPGSLNTSASSNQRPVTSNQSPEPWLPLTDYLENSILRDILKSGLKCPASTLRSILFSDFCTLYDPFREYFSLLPPCEENLDYIDLLSSTVTTTEPLLWQVCFKKWLVASVASVLDHKTVNHTAIILSGPQGIGKTTWMLNLCPPELSEYLFSGTINPGNKDTLIHLSECMFINMDELENMNRTEIGTFKEIITKSAIRIRRAYGHNNDTLTRRASFMGSVNSSQFLSDTTGSRRFLCFEVKKIDYHHHIDLRMAYSQALRLYSEGYRYYFDQNEIEIIAQNNDQFQYRFAEEELLLTYCRPVPIAESNTFRTASQLLVYLSERAHVNLPVNPGTIIRMGRALKRHGFEKYKSNGLYLWAVQDQMRD
jgi:hypothetical protein